MSRQFPSPRALLVAALLALAGCRSTSAPPPVFVDPVSPAQRLAQVEALASSVDDELSVQPLRDPQVEDLREQARDARGQGDLAQAITAVGASVLGARVYTSRAGQALSRKRTHWA